MSILMRHYEYFITLYECVYSALCVNKNTSKILFGSLSSYELRCSSHITGSGHEKASIDHLNGK